MSQLTVGVRELKEQLSGYIRQVEAGATVTITVHGKPVGRIVPLGQSVEERIQEAIQAGWVAWSGRKLAPRAPIARTVGDKMVADLLLEDRE